MELFLNLAWLTVSLILVVGWIWSIHKGHIEFQWTALIALALLIVILFPVISMTDDRMAMNMPVEVEHMLRRNEAPLSSIAVLGLLGMFAALLLVLFRRVLPRLLSRIGTRVFGATLLDGFIRAFGVRPPPAPFFATC